MLVEQLTGNREGMGAKFLSWQGAEERMKPIELMRLGINSERLYFFLYDNDRVPHFISPPGQAEETVCVSVHLTQLLPLNLGETPAALSTTN